MGVDCAMIFTNNSHIEAKLNPPHAYNILHRFRVQWMFRCKTLTLVQQCKAKLLKSHTSCSALAGPAEQSIKAIIVQMEVSEIEEDKDYVRNIDQITCITLLYHPESKVLTNV